MGAWIHLVRMPIEPLEVFIVARQLTWALKILLGPVLGYSVFDSSGMYAGFFTRPTQLITMIGLAPSTVAVEFLWGMPVLLLSLTHLIFITRDINRDITAQMIHATPRVWTAMILFSIYMSQASAFAHVSIVSTAAESYFWYAIGLLYIILRLFIRNRLFSS